MAAELLLQGGVVAIPTETVYGLAANALNEAAVARVFEVKERPFFDPLIVHVKDKESAKKYATFDDPKLAKLARTYWPGPLTVLLPRKEIIPDIITAGLDRVAIRVPDNETTLNLLKKAGIPLAAPSANPFGYVSPTSPEHVNKQLGRKIDYILDGGICRVGLESTIVGSEDGKIIVYRLGGLSIEEVEKVVGKVELKINNSSNPKVPGQLKSHYAPKKPLLIGDVQQLLAANTGKKIALIGFGEHIISNGNVEVFNLSEAGYIREAALNLFRMLRMADESDADVVIASLLPEEGLGLAINDRLNRASAR